MVRLITRHFWIVNLIFVAAAVWIAVYLGMAVVKDQLSPIPKKGPAKGGISTVSAKGGKAYEQYAVIPDRNIFDPSEKGLKLLPLGAGRIESGTGGEGPKAGPPGSYRLIGTITGPGSYSFAIIQDASGKQVIHPVYSDLGGAKIVRISRKEVVILREGGEETLLLAEGSAAPKTALNPGLTPVGTADVVKRLSPNRFVVNREDVNNAVGNVNQFMTQARVKPFLQSGRPSGFTISEIQTGSLIEKLGMRNNDIIKKVNGQPINKPEEIFQAYSQLQRDGNIEIEIERNERAEVLKYEIR